MEQKGVQDEHKEREGISREQKQLWRRPTTLDEKW